MCAQTDRLTHKLWFGTLAGKRESERHRTEKAQAMSIVRGAHPSKRSGSKKKWLLIWATKVQFSPNWTDFFLTSLPLIASAMPTSVFTTSVARVVCPLVSPSNRRAAKRIFTLRKVFGGRRWRQLCVSVLFADNFARRQWHSVCVCV